MVFEGICLEKRLGVSLQNHVSQNISQISSVRLFVKSSQIFDFLCKVKKALGPQNNYSVTLLILLPCQVSNLVFTTHKS